MERIEQLLRTWSETHDEPCCAFIYDLAQLRAHVAERVRGLPPAIRLFYAIKANAEAPILRALAPLVHGFEVASLGEVRKVRAVDADVPIIFGGPGKTDGEIEGALDLGVERFHVESLHELRRIAHIGERRGVRVPILLRINLRGPFPVATLQMGGATQFGIDEDSALDAIQLAQVLPSIDLQGFHFHLISNQLAAAAHAQLVAYYIQRALGWAAEAGVRLRVINAGGGIGVNYADLAQQFDWAAFQAALHERCAPLLPAHTTLMFECGRYLTASCGYYAAEVLDLKHNHGRSYAVVRGGTNHFRLPASWQHSHPFAIVPVERWPYPFPRPEIADAPLSVVGQLCTPKDVLAREVPVGRVRAGDILLFQYAGAYGWAISHHDFLSHPHPAHVYLDDDRIMAEHKTA